MPLLGPPHSSGEPWEHWLSLGLPQWPLATASPAVLVRLFLVVQLVPLVAWQLRWECFTCSWLPAHCLTCRSFYAELRGLCLGSPLPPQLLPGAVLCSQDSKRSPPAGACGVGWVPCLPHLPSSRISLGSRDTRVTDGRGLWRLGSCNVSTVSPVPGLGRPLVFSARPCPDTGAPS